MKLYFQLFLLFSLGTLFAQPISSDEYFVRKSLSDFNIKGKVKSIKTNAKDSFGNWATLPFHENEYYNQYTLEFNPKGNLIKRTNFLDYKGILGVYNFVENWYSDKHLIINQKVTIVNNGEDPLRVSSEKSYHYSKDDNLLELTEIVNGKNSTSTYQTQFIYSNRLDEVITKIDQVKSNISRYTYNSNGNLISIKNTSFDGKSGLSKFFIYDDNTLVYKEEAINNRKLITYFNADETSFLQIFNEKQQLDYQVNFNKNREIISYKKSYYRYNQNILETFTVNYTYDHVGNWIEAKVATNNQIKFTVNREIHYY